MDWKPDALLRPDQSARPLSKVTVLANFQIPEFTDEMLEVIFKDNQAKSRRLRTWGKVNNYSPHFLATRAGTKMHTDPAYPRFSWHVILHNGGFKIRGLSDIEQPILAPGTLYLLDTHSPHEVVRDTRMTQISNYKVQIAVDADQPMPQDVIVEQIREYVAGKNIFEMMTNA